MQYINGNLWQKQHRGTTNQLPTLSKLGCGRDRIAKSLQHRNRRTHDLFTTRDHAVTYDSIKSVVDQVIAGIPLLDQEAT